MKDKIQQFVHKFLRPELDLRVRLFNVLAMAGTLISLLMAVAGIVAGTGIANVLINLLTMGLSYALLSYSQRTGKYEVCYIITIVAIFLALFPALFFSSGGYLGGMPSFFVFAVVFTIFMLDGRRALLLALLELCAYIGLCIFAYLNPQTVLWFADEQSVLGDIIVGFATVSVALGIALFLHFRLYDAQQKQLMERNEELDRINHQKTEFLSNISHELKTPLTVLSTQIQLGRQNLEQGGDIAETLETMYRVSGEVERMALMINQMLEVGRIDEGRMLVDLKRESIVEIIQTTLNHYYPEFSKNRNRLTFRSEGRIPDIRGDRVRIAQVLVNLIGNASRHTRDGEISISVQPGEQEVLVSVRDTGDGIEPERMAHLFERYSSHRAPASEKKRPGRDTGTGLGLYICRYIVEMHAGRIWIESEPGHGTTAFFTIPADI